ncbi:response regulator [Marivirga arenosa]|uniref:Response regulator n=1 Tax=Marivirga arenosa TaxID=3059076 RepID=A0AA49GDE7_9BACT|nr:MULTISPECIES: response regulator [unclassified Marivirga]WKK80047.1 response regulator [Marivirga sp. BKB1-2]WKK84903.1 response regulator [Marivirga sp. ABR2-2]
MAENKKVLIAEDSSVIQNLTKKILMMQNYSIHSAKNGEQVLKALEKESFDIILMDINMPKMDGMECTRAIRALDDEQKSSIPIIAITGNAKNYTNEEFKEAGINEYLQKPLNFDQLVETVKKLTN